MSLLLGGGCWDYFYAVTRECVFCCLALLVLSSCSSRSILRLVGCNEVDVNCVVLLVRVIKSTMRLEGEVITNLCLQAPLSRLQAVIQFSMFPLLNTSKGGVITQRFNCP